MTVREWLEDVIGELPDDASVTLPVGYVRERLVSTDEGDELVDLTVAEAADLLEMARSTVRGYILGGKLEAYKLGRGYRIKRSALRAFSDKAAAGPDDRSAGESVDLTSWRSDRTRAS